MSPGPARTLAEALEVGRQGEVVLDAAFGPEFIIVIANSHHQRQGIDRFFVHRRDGRVMYRVDYKNDEMAGTTGNLALEHVSVVRKGRREVSGWVHTSYADLVVSYVPALDRAFVLEVDALRLAWPDIMRLFPPRFARTGGPEPYQSLVCCVPIVWLERAGLIARSVDAVGAQLRLPLKVGVRR